MNLEECRKRIDSIDVDIIALLNRRAEVAKHIGSLKAQAGLPVVDAQREARILQKISRENTGELRGEAAARIYRQILHESRKIQIKTQTNLVRHGEISK